MKVPQNALAQIARDEMHLQLNLLPSVNLHSFKKDLSKIWSNAFTGINDPTINNKHKRAGDAANIIVGFRPELWRDLFKMPIPSNLQGFTKDLVGLNNHSVPAAQCDIWLWITHISPATLYDTVFNIRALLGPFTTLVSEQTCFPYYNNVTFDGFADGVANPNSFKAPGTVIIDEGQVGEGGITALVQKWSMDVDRLRGLSVHEGERVYGRRKVSSEELDPQPIDSHVSRNQFKRNGVEVDIVRRNSNYRNTDDMGIMFIGLCKDIDVTLGMLQQMLGVGPDGISQTDKLLNFSTAKSSAVYFIPSISDLALAGIEPEDEG